MGTGYNRPLIKDPEVESFVDSVLNMYDASPEDKRAVINSIIAAERNLAGAGTDASTMQQSFRDFQYRSDKERELLNNRILKELVELERLSDDDDIILGKGGAKPPKGIVSEKKAFYIIGPPASGKSGISNKIADTFGAYILDSDYAKRKFPEYSNQISGASVVHEESDQLIFRRMRGNLLAHCLSQGHNIVIPKIGHQLDSIVAMCNALKTQGYAVYLISVDLDRIKATWRAYMRYHQTHRYVPLSLVFDGYGNDPTLNYFKAKQQHSNLFSGFAQISTDVPIKEPCILLEEQNLPELNTIYGRAKYASSKKKRKS